jgi:pilus assembly protein CpaE
MNQNRIRIVIADDSPLTRHVLVQLIASQHDMEVVGEASNGHDAVRLATEQQPDIVLMDIHMPGLDGLQAAWLVSSRVPRGAVIMVTAEQRQDFLDKAVAAGAKGYIIKPFDEAELLTTVREVHREASERRTALRTAGEDGDDEAQTIAPHVGRTIAVLGSKGGVGRTTIAVGLALALQQHGRTAIVDADFMFGDTAIHLDLSTDHSIVDLVPYADSLDSFTLSQVLDTHRSGVDLLARPLRPEQADVVTADLVRSVVAVLNNLYDFVVVDTQLSYDERMLAVLDQADVFLLVLSGQLGALRNTRHFLDVAKMVGYPEDRMCFVLNRADSLGGFKFEDVASVVDTRRILQVPSAGGSLSESINMGAPLVLTQPQSPFARAIANLAEHVRVLASSKQSRALTG